MLNDVTVAIETVDNMVIKRPFSKSTTKYRKQEEET
jgi:hypothetical protein